MTTEQTKPQAVNPKIEAVLEGFDFHRVKHAMFALKWKWVMPGAVMRIPELDEIEAHARQMLYGIEPDPYPMVSTQCGGFRAERNEWGNYRLSFVIEDVGNDDL